MALIKPDRSRILKEASLRALNNGEFRPGEPLKTSQTRGLSNYHIFLDTTRDEFERRHGYFDMATASGKTGLFSLLGRHAYRVAQERGIGDTFKTLIVESSVFLLHQTRNELLKIAPELAGAVGIYGGEDRDLSKPFTIISYESWLALLESGQLNGADIDLNINDEAHKGLSVRRQNMINQVLTDTHHLGFTASAQYDREKTMELTHRNLIYRLSLKDAIEDGILADYVQVQYGVLRLLPKGMSRKREVDPQNLDFTALKRTEWARMVTHAYREGIDGVTGAPLSDKVALFFGANTAHADYLADMLNKDPVLARKAEARGFRDVAVSIHSVGYSSAIQNDLMKAFRAGEYMAAVGDKKFQAGYDDRRVKFIASYPGKSLVDTVQEMGRATRFYIDPITGESQGAVILETAPYIGDADPEVDNGAYRRALRGLVTAKDVLGDTLILKRGHSVSLPPPKGRGSIRVPLSAGSTVEFLMTHEETLTISRQVDESRIKRPDLTEAQIVEWIKATKDKTGIYPAPDHKDVWQFTEDGFELIEGETWRTIEDAIRRGTRGLIKPDGSLLASSLSEFKQKHGFIDERNLTVTQIIEWIKATLEKTGKLPSSMDEVVWEKNADGSFEIVKGESWKNIDSSLRRKLRGLINADGSPIALSLSDFKEKYGFDRILTEEKILNYLYATQEKTGKSPIKKDRNVFQYGSNGQIELVLGETWEAIDEAFRRGKRGLLKNDGSRLAASLADFKRQHGFVDERKKPKQKPAADIKKPIVKTEPAPESPALQADAATLARDMVAGLFAQLSGDLVNKVTEAVVEKLRGSIPAAEPPVMRLAKKVSEKPDFAATPLTAEDIAASLPVRAQQELPRGIDYESLQAPLLHKEDAMGDSMISCLQNAQRDFVHQNRVGLRANLRKLVELFVHHTISAAEQYLPHLQLPDERRVSAARIIRDYHYECAKTELDNRDKDKPGQGRHRIEAGDQIKTLRDLLQILGTADSALFPIAELLKRITSITRAGREIHLQFNGKERSEDAQLLQNAYELARWFNGRFPEKADQTPQPPVEAIVPAPAAPAPAAPAPAEVVIEKPVIPPAAAVESPAPPELGPLILKSLGVTQEQFAEAARSDAQTVAMIVAFMQDWKNEEDSTKAARNRLITARYADVRPRIEELAGKGRSVETIAAILNKEAPSYNPATGSALIWTPSYLLRGALLNRAVLPLESFKSLRGLPFARPPQDPSLEP
jgi:superfamily II DNA or RNA helicase